jgi:hypothetical protein
MYFSFVNVVSSILIQNYKIQKQTTKLKNIDYSVCVYGKLIFVKQKRAVIFASQICSYYFGLEG